MRRRAAASANLEENSPKTRCWLRCSIRPNVATSQNTVGAAVAQHDLPSVRAARTASRSPSRTDPTTSRTGACRCDVPIQRAPGRGQRRQRLRADLRRPAAEAPVAGSSAGGDSWNVRGQPRSLCQHERTVSPHLQAHRFHRRVRHAGRRRQGQGPQGRGGERHRLRGRRAGLPDARSTSSRRPWRPAGTRRTTATRPPAACPSCGRPSRSRPSGTPASTAPRPTCWSRTAASTRCSRPSPRCATPATR